MSYEFDPVYETAMSDDLAILAHCEIEAGEEALYAEEAHDPYIEEYITRTAEGHIIVDMAALVNALRMED